MDFNKLGQTIKQIRLNKNLSIKSLADDISVSSSLLSQIERGLANPSLNTLRSIAARLEVPMFSLFIDNDADYAMVVRKNERLKISEGETNSKDIKLEYDLLSPDLKGDIQMCEMVLGPRQTSAKILNSHYGEETAVCTEGKIELVLEHTKLLLNKGDSVRIRKGSPHKWENPTDEKCAIIFSISPPTF